jgi:3-oxoadipate enol-lactonase
MRRRTRPEIYWREGGRGPALVLLNGWSTSGLAWPRAWVRALERDFRVLRIDNRGSGYSRFARTPFTLSDLADDVLTVLDEVEVDRAVVAGMSMGGMIAQEFALAHQDRLAGLVVIASRPPAPAYAPPAGSSLLLDLLAPPGRGETLESYFTRLWTMGTGVGFADREPAAIAELVAQIVARPTPRSMLIHQLRAVNGWGHAERLAQVTVPTAIVHGDGDPLIDVANGRCLAELIPGSLYFELKGVGHLPPLEAPNQLLDVIADVASEPSALTTADTADDRTTASGGAEVVTGSSLELVK